MAHTIKGTLVALAAVGFLGGQAQAMTSDMAHDHGNTVVAMKHKGRKIAAAVGAGAVAHHVHKKHKEKKARQQQGAQQQQGAK